MTNVATPLFLNHIEIIIFKNFKINWFLRKVKELDLKKLVRCDGSMGTFWGGKVSYKYGKLTVYYGMQTHSNPRKLGLFLHI